MTATYFRRLARAHRYALGEVPPLTPGDAAKSGEADPSLYRGHKDFLKAIADNPNEEAAVGAYSDWLRDQGLENTAAFLDAHTAAHRGQNLNWRYQSTNGVPSDLPAGAERHVSVLSVRPVFDPTPNAVELWQRGEDGNHALWKLYGVSDADAKAWVRRLRSEGAEVPLYVRNEEARKAAARAKRKPRKDPQ